MKIKIGNIEIKSHGLCAEYIKKDNATFDLKVILNRPCDELRQECRVKCKNVLPVKFFFKHHLHLHDGYSVEDKYSWGNNELKFMIKSNIDIKKIKLNCDVKEVSYELRKKECIEAESCINPNEYTIICPYNKVIIINGYDLSEYVRTHNNKICGNEYEDYLRDLDNVCIEYKEKGLET